MGAVLLPNLGAEEGDESTAPRPGYPDAALLWQLLFSKESRLVDREPSPTSPFRSEHAIFPWLENAGGGVPWLSTERAARRLSRMGLRLVGPDPAVVHIVHDKAFAHRVASDAGLLPQSLSSSLRVFEPEELTDSAAVEEALASFPPWVENWVLKPRFGSSGRGRVPGRGREVAAVAAAGLPRLARRGGAVLEPWLDRIADLSAQLHVGDERVVLLGTTTQLVGPTGVYLGNRGILDGDHVRSGSLWDDELVRAAMVVGEAARKAGFRGPCGIDAFVYRDPAGQPVLRPVVELNARFTMGTVALGLVARAREAGMTEGARSFLFRLRGEDGPDTIRLGAGSTLELGREAGIDPLR